MDEELMRNMTMERTRKKFGSHEVLNGKYSPRIPASAEREYVRICNAYMRILKEELEKQLPAIKTVYQKELESDLAEKRRNDSVTGLLLSIIAVFNSIKNSLVIRLGSFGLEKKLKNVSTLTRKQTTKEWERMIRKTLGIDIREDYYLGSFYQDQLQKWVSDNVDLIKTIPEDTLDKMRQIIYDGYVNGTPTTKLVKEIQQSYQVGKRHAGLIARDQIAKLNGQIQQAQQQDAGITSYRWNTSGDQRVRKSHRDLDGKIFHWDDPPENSDGRKCHPGQDYNCRCVAIPVFDRNRLNLPLADDKEKTGGMKN